MSLQEGQSSRDMLLPSEERIQTAYSATVMSVPLIEINRVQSAPDFSKFMYQSE